MSLRDTDIILIAPEAIAYIEQEEAGETASLSKFEIVELFFEWLKKQPPSYQMSFLKKALK